MQDPTSGQIDIWVMVTSTINRYGPAMLVALISWVLAVFGRDRRRFHGRWEATIEWEPDWGNKLLGCQATNPRSHSRQPR